MTTTTTDSTKLIKCKCMKCGLHFTAFSWQDDWRPNFCPECGQKDKAFMIWLDHSEKEIFQFVPGDS